MNKHTVNNLHVYLMNFQKNYRYFVLSDSNDNSSSQLDQFVNDQAMLAQIIYGNHGSDMVKELAMKLAGSEHIN